MKTSATERLLAWIRDNPGRAGAEIPKDVRGRVDLRRLEKAGRVEWRRDGKSTGWYLKA